VGHNLDNAEVLESSQDVRLHDLDVPADVLDRPACAEEHKGWPLAIADAQPGIGKNKCHSVAITPSHCNAGAEISMMINDPVSAHRRKRKHGGTVADPARQLWMCDAPRWAIQYALTLPPVAHRAPLSNHDPMSCRSSLGASTGSRDRTNRHRRQVGLMPDTLRRP